MEGKLKQQRLQDRTNSGTETTNDYVLLDKARSGDPVAFHLLYERHGSAIFSFLYRLSSSVETADDITHDSFLSLIRHSTKALAPTTDSFRVQLYSTARTLLMEHIRNSPIIGRIAVQGPGSSGENPNTAFRKESPAEVRAAVGNLPHLEREVLILSDYEGLRLSEIATIVGADDKEVFARLERARQRLRDKLKIVSKREKT